MPAVPQIQAGDLLWTPDAGTVAASNLVDFLHWLRRHRSLSLADYEALWHWSVTDTSGFWSAIWDYFEVLSDQPYDRVIDRLVMPGATWFAGSRVNYAEHLLRHEATRPADAIAFHHGSEVRELATMTWTEVGRQVRILATQLRALGIAPGDRVAAYLPNVPEAAIAMMATAAIGAVWSSASPEFGARTVIDRYAQIEPKLLFVADGYRFAGRDYDRSREARTIAAALPSLTQVVWLPYLYPDKASPPVDGALDWNELLAHPDVPREIFRYQRVGHDHPLWVLFSSGTTGLPKAIVHSHVGVLVEHLKLMSFHLDLKPGSTMFFHSTTGWMMWNLVIATLLTGASAVLYDGSPFHPEPDHLWRIAAATGTSHFGASPTFVQMMEKAGLEPGRHHDLSRLRAITLSGAPSTPETFAWFHRAVKADVWVSSQSGGTEIASGFVGASPTLPVRAGEIQVRMLGMDVRAWQPDGSEPLDAVGELVCVRPFPSMPLRFWNDAGDRRYHEAYFEAFPGVWRHGDFIRINGRGGAYIHGRSDSTLNRNGVRIGTAEVYRVVEQIDAVADSLIVCCALPGGHWFMPLFVQLKPGGVLDERLIATINERLRQDCSPRHVPDRIYAVESIPYTLTGKKMEVPVRRLLLGMAPEAVASRDAMLQPDAIDWFVRFAQESLDYQWRRPVGDRDRAA